MQEAVFESLTKEYELAKVQEVKEIPVVKVLDSPSIPDKKSYPPRLWIMVLGTGSTVALGIAWLVGRTAWDQTDLGDPRKVIAQEIFTTLNARLPRFPRNGSGTNSGGESVPGRHSGAFARR